MADDTTVSVKKLIDGYENYYADALTVGDYPDAEYLNKVITKLKGYKPETQFDMGDLNSITDKIRYDEARTKKRNSIITKEEIDKPINSRFDILDIR